MLAAGAAGMLCGSCLRDNRVAGTLRAQGRDVVLIPLYTPLRTDEADASDQQIFFGGINVYLQQKSALFRRLPRSWDRWLDSRRLLGGIGRLAARTRPEELGELTVSMLRGEQGRQRKELERLIDGLRALRPALVCLPDLMLLGAARRIREALGVPVVCTLSGEDIFVDELPAPWRAEAMELIRERAADVDAFIGVTRYFCAYAAQHFGLPRARIRHVPLGIALDQPARTVRVANDPPVIAYLARVCPAKGLAELARALVALREGGSACRVRAAGYLGAADRPYLDAIVEFVRERGCADAFEYMGEVDRSAKWNLLQSADLFCVPTVYHEAKGLFILEALAADLPVVQPRHGSFPELVEETGGGVLYNPADPGGLHEALAALLRDQPRRGALGAAGRAAVEARHSDARMADETWRVFEDVVSEAGRT